MRPVTKHGLQMAATVFGKSETTETGTTGGTIEDTDRGRDPKSEGETEVGPEIGRRSHGGSGATPEKEEGEDTKMASETGREIGERGSGVGVGRSGDHGEVGAIEFGFTSLGGKVS